MADPTSTAAATLVAAGVTVPVLTVFGVPLGLRPDLLMAGFAGALAAIVLLNSVPATGDTWRAMVGTSLRRMAVVLTSSITAGYMVPLVPLLSGLVPVMANIPDSLMLGFAFAIGGGAQKFMARAVERVAGAATPDQKGGAT